MRCAGQENQAQTDINVLEPRAESKESANAANTFQKEIETDTLQKELET